MLDVVWVKGLPVTRVERTLVDLCLDCEKWSLVRDAMRDAGRIDNGRLIRIVESLPNRKAIRDGLVPVLEYLQDHREGECR